MSPTIRAAAVHAAPVFMNKTATITKVVELIRKGKGENLELLVFPETFVPGYPYFIECYAPLDQVPALAQYAEQSVVVDDGDLQAVQAACKENEVSVCLGVSERVLDGHTLFNSQVYIDQKGVIIGVHRKLQPTYVERVVWAQGSGHTLHVYDDFGDYRLGGLCCWENTMNGARQALIDQGQQIHAGAWPALSTMKGFEAAADAQIEALMKNHALTAQVFVICASNYVDDTCLEWMEKNLGPQDKVKHGGGWSSVIHPFCIFLAGPHTGAEEKLVAADIDLSQLGVVKVWIDSGGHYRRPEILRFSMDNRPLWPDDLKARRSRGAAVVDGDQDGEDDVAVPNKKAEIKANGAPKH